MTLDGAGDISRLKQEALDQVISHMTPKQWMTESGPWVLDRGEGVLLYDVDGREYLDAMAGGTVRRPRRLRAGGNRPSHVRAGPTAVLHQPGLGHQPGHRRAGPETGRVDTRRSARVLLLQQRFRSGGSVDQTRWSTSRTCSSSTDRSPVWTRWLWLPCPRCSAKSPQRAPPSCSSATSLISSRTSARTSSHQRRRNGASSESSFNRSGWQGAHDMEAADKSQLKREAVTGARGTDPIDVATSSVEPAPVVT